MIMVDSLRCILCLSLIIHLGTILFSIFHKKWFILVWNHWYKNFWILTKPKVYQPKCWKFQKIHKEIVYGEQKNLKHVFRNLKEHHYYLFWVVACTNVGEGRPSAKVTQMPLSRGTLLYHLVFLQVGFTKSILIFRIYH